MNTEELVIWELEPFRVILRNNRYFIQDNNIYYKQYTDVCSVNDKIIAVLIAHILSTEFHGLPVNHRVKDVYLAEMNQTVREHLYTFSISEALGVEFKEVT